MPLIPPTGTVTFLFTDIEGSTQLWEQHADAMRPALARHDATLRQSIEDHAGFVFKTIGDAFCAAFATADQALEAALAAQIVLAAEPWELPTPLRVRMALHTGSAEERGGDYFGPPLNRVTRLMAAGHGGQVLISGATQELTQDHLPPLTTLRDLGQRRLKDLERPEHVYQVCHPSLTVDFPPLRSLDNPALPNNLPQQITRFIGREKEIHEVKGLLARTRLLTLTGAGGSGKTRLSLQIAADFLDQYFDGVWLVELAALSNPALLPHAVAAVLGVREEVGQPISARLRDWLKTKHLLIVLDNCEHLVGACAALAVDLLRNCSGVHLLASSREPLNVTGEQTYRVPSLSLPDPAQAQTVESLSQYEAVALFIERAQAAQPLFSVVSSNAPAVAQVCWRLDGIPLAIELAAARVRSLAVEEVNARLDNRFRLLTGGSRTALPRQQTLRALIDWSYDLLSDGEKTMLCRLSVFVGGWTLPAAEAVCQGGGIEEWEVVDLLTSLVDKSLVLYEEGAGDRDRYRFLESVRQYARDRLAESGQAAETQGQYAAWSLALAAQAEAHLAGPEQGDWLTRLETEHDNFRAVLAWCEKPVEGQPSVEGGIGLRLAAALWRFWQMRGHFSEGRQRLDRALTQHADVPGAEDSQARAKALNGSGVLAYCQGEYGLAQGFWEQCLLLCRRQENQSGIAASLSNLGLVATDQGEYGTAQIFYEESLVLRRQSGEQNGIALTLNNLGRLAARQGDYGMAQVRQEESLTLYQEVENPSGVSAVLSCLGELACGEGNYEAAQSFWEQSLALDQQMGNQNGVAGSLSSLGEVACLQGEYEKARVRLDESLTLFRQVGNQNGVAAALSNLGHVAADQGQYGAALEMYRESLALRRQSGDRPSLAYSLEEIAGAALGQNRPAEAVHLRGTADALREAVGAPLPPAERQRQDNELSAARTSLGDAAFAAAWETGRAMTLEQAMEYALLNTSSETAR